jgi:hypothetical protein
MASSFMSPSPVVVVIVVYWYILGLPKYIPQLEKTNRGCPELVSWHYPKACQSPNVWLVLQWSRTVSAPEINSLLRNLNCLPLNTCSQFSAWQYSSLRSPSMNKILLLFWSSLSLFTQYPSDSVVHTKGKFGGIHSKFVMKFDMIGQAV